MTFKQFIIIPIGIAILAFILMLADMGFGSFTKYFVVWVAFQAWAMYFMAGCKLESGVKVMAGYLGGALASVAIFELGGVLGFLGQMAIPVAVLIVVVPVISAERVPVFNFVPAWFVGAGVFFALHAGNYVETGTKSLLSCFVGVLFGIVTVIFRTRYEASVASASAESAPAAQNTNAE